MTDHTIYIGASQVARVAKKLTKTLLANAGDVREVGLIPGSIRSLGGGHGNPLQYSCLENPHGQRSLARYSPWSCKESNTTEQLSIAQNAVNAPSRSVFLAPTPTPQLLEILAYEGSQLSSMVQFIPLPSSGQG